MGLAPGRNGETPGKSVVAKVPVPISSQPRTGRTSLDDAAHGPEERLRREQSDFLAYANHEGEKADFHALRHTTGAWLAMAGVHPKVVQTVMRHSAITLTMDTYGHLFPGQDAAAVAALPSMMNGP
jgi:integrase